MTREQVAEDRVYFSLITGADDERGRGADYWLFPHGLLSLLFYPTQDHQPRDGTTHNGVGIPSLITN